MQVRTEGRGLYEITDSVRSHLNPEMNGLLHLFVQHTSCSLIIQENADPSARRDLEEFYNRLVPDGQSWHQHTLEGDDDTTAHMKSTLTQTELMIPVQNGRLQMGIWQGIYIFEHRERPHTREIKLHLVEAKELS